MSCNVTNCWLVVANQQSVKLQLITCDLTDCKIHNIASEFFIHELLRHVDVS